MEAVPDKTLSAVAWTAILSASGLAEIVWRVGLGGHWTVWIAVVQLGALLLLLGLVRTWRAVRPLTAFVSALAALGGGFVALFLLERGTGFTAWTDRGPQYQVVPAESALLCLPTLVMLAVAFGFGFRRRRSFSREGTFTHRAASRARAAGSTGTGWAHSPCSFSPFRSACSWR